jgi:hypothetical protein
MNAERKFPLLKRPNPEINLERFLIQLPNGGHLKYAKGYQSGPMWRGKGLNKNPTWLLFKNIEIPDDHTNADGTPNLNKIFKLNLWSSGTTQHVVCADFDDLPNNFRDFEEFREHLEWRYSCEAVITKSRSGKAKAFFVVELPLDTEMTNEIALIALNRILEPLLFNLCDRGGLNTTWLMPEMKEALHNKLHKLSPISIEPPKKEIPSFRVFNGCLQIEIHNFIFNKDKQTNYVAKEKFIRILLATPGLKKSFCLSTSKLGVECGVSAMCISRWIKELVKNGWLKVLNKGHYVAGKIAKAYKAQNELLLNLELNYPTVAKQSGTAPPTTVKAGNWNKAIWQAICYYGGDEDLAWGWFEECDGHECNGRISKMRGALKRYHNRRSKPRAA